VLGPSSLEHYGSYASFRNSTSTLNSVLDSRRMTGTMLSQLIDGIVVGLVVVLLFCCRARRSAGSIAKRG